MTEGRGTKYPRRVGPLRLVREELGWTQADVAARAGCAIGTVSRIESLRVGEVRLDSLIRVAHAVGMAPTDLVPGLDARPRTPGASILTKAYKLSKYRSALMRAAAERRRLESEGAEESAGSPGDSREIH